MGLHTPILQHLEGESNFPAVQGRDMRQLTSSHKQYPEALILGIHKGKEALYELNGMSVDVHRSRHHTCHAGLRHYWRPVASRPFLQIT